MTKKELPTAHSEPAAAEAGPAVGAAALHFAPDELDSVLLRLKRAQGQIGGIIRMIEAGRECADIVTQMAAVSKALDRVGFAVIAAGLKQCLTEDPSSERTDTSSLEKLFLSLA
ncbi:MAG: metal-sensitive transcriptional regulator [Propionibacteriaceae bacterium]|nr:metal-sensitive transcriptional regulator [Propionibacteriaceae bacterium]